MGDVKNKQVNIYIDQTAAEASLDKLQLKADGFNKKIDDARKKQAALNEEIKKAEAAGKSTTKLQSQYQSLEKEIVSSTDKIKTNVQEQKKLQDQLDKGLAPSLRQQENLVKNLRNELSNLSKDAPGYAEKFKAFQQSKVYLSELKNEMEGVQKVQRSWFAEAKTIALGVVIGNTVQAALQALGGYLSGILTGNAKLSDSLADLRRVAGLTAAEADNLNKSLGKIDTRTSTSGLRDIAIIAGKLGVAKNDIVDFTQAVDKLVVALGDELGNADTITTELGKILNVFDGKITGENITQLGNAIVDLANKGVTTGAFLVDFTQRVAGIAKSANIALPAVLGLAAGLEESGSKPESAATAIQKLITTIATDLPGAAKVSGVSVADFNKLFAEKPQEALLQYAAGLQKNKGSFAAIASAFKDAGEEGARTISTLATLGQKTDFFRKKIEETGVAIQNTDEIQAAFDLKNNDLAAQLEKLSKVFTSFIQSKTLTDLFTAGVQGVTAFINALKAVPHFINENIVGISLLVAGLVTMNLTYIISGAKIIWNTALKLINAAATKAQAIATNLAIAAQAAYITITEFLTARITLATAAQRLWNITTSLGAGAVGGIIVAVGVLVVAISSLVGKQKELTAEQRVQNELLLKASELSREEEVKAKSLFQTLQQQSLSYEAKKKVLNDLIALSPQYLGGLTLENIKTQEGTEILNTYLSKLEEINKAKALQTILIEKETKAADLRARIASLDNATDKKGDFLKDVFGIGGTSSGEIIVSAQGELSQIEADLKVLYKQTAENISKTVVSATEANLTGIASTTLASLKKQLQDLDTAFESIDVKNLAALKANRDERKKIQDEINRIEGKDTKEKKDKELEDAVNRLKKIQDEFNKITKSGLDFGLDKIFAVKAEDEALFKKKFAGKALEDALKQLHIVTQASIEELLRNLKSEGGKLQGPKQDTPVIKALGLDEDGLKELDKANARLKRHLDFDTINGLELKTLTEHGKKKLQADIDYLEEKKKIELENAKLVDSDIALINEKYRQQEEKLQRDFLKKQLDNIDEFLGNASQIIDILSKFNDAKSAKENAALNKELKANDAKKASYQRLLNSKSISDAKYNQLVADLDKESDAKKEALDKKQNERKRKYSIAQALINGAQGVTKAIAEYPFPAYLLPVALAVATTAAQVANINAQKFALGGKTNGPSHSAGGMPVMNPQTGHKVAELEGDEGILKKSAMHSGKSYSVTGTPSQIASTLNGMYGGVRWDSSAIVRPHYQTRAYQPVDYSRINKTFSTLRFAEGGRFSNSSDTSAAAPATDPTLLTLLEQNQIINAQLHQSVSNLHEQLKKPITALMTLRTLTDTQSQLDRILKDATFK